MGNSHGGSRRKNVGYLWAIAHGATVIYETDDDHVLLDPHIMVLKAGVFPRYVANPSQRTVNVYQSFGQPHMWPRGLPLADVKVAAPTLFERHWANPLIQQGKPCLHPVPCQSSACLDLG
jgi:hypothetical protein